MGVFRPGMRLRIACGMSARTRSGKAWRNLWAGTCVSLRKSRHPPVLRARIQYFGTLESISSDQALMPPLTLLTYLKPCCFRKLTALSERTPPLQCK